MFSVNTTMFANDPISLWFTAGVLIEACLLLGLNFTFGRSLVIFLITLAMVAVVWFLVREYYTLFCYAFTAIFAAYFVYQFNKFVLPQITELTILQFTLVFVYVLYTAFSPKILPFYFQVALIIPCLWVLVLAFIPSPLGRFGKFITYVWFLGMIASVLIVQVLTWFIPAISGSGSFGPTEALIGGMMFLALLLYGSYFANLISTDWRENWLIKEYLIVNFDDSQLSFWQTCTILILQGGLLGANYWLHFAPSAVITGASLAVAPLGLKLHWFLRDRAGRR